MPGSVFAAFAELLGECVCLNLASGTLAEWLEAHSRTRHLKVSEGSWVSVAFVKRHDRKQLREERTYFGVQFSGCTGRELEAEAEAVEGHRLAYFPRVASPAVDWPQIIVN